jgi:hypothetical protein
MKVYGGVDVQIQVFLTSTLFEGEWSASRTGRFTPSTRWIGGWVYPRTGLDVMEKRKFLPLLAFELRSPGRPARSQSLYRLQLWDVSTFKFDPYKFPYYKFLQYLDCTLSLISQTVLKEQRRLEAKQNLHKFRHKPHCSSTWSLYTSPIHREGGGGRGK